VSAAELEASLSAADPVPLPPASELLTASAHTLCSMQEIFRVAALARPWQRAELAGMTQMLDDLIRRCVRLAPQDVAPEVPRILMPTDCDGPISRYSAHAPAPVDPVGTAVRNALANKSRH